MSKVFSAIGRYIKQTDRTLFLFSLLAAAYGFILVYSATYSSNRGALLNRTDLTQLIAIGLGLAVMIVLSKIDYHTLAAFWKYIAIASVAIMLVTLFFGTGREGSEDKSWFYIFGVSTQPAEFVKVAFILTFAKHFDIVKHEVSSVKNVLLLVLHGAIPTGIIVLQKDMGMAIVYGAIFLFMVFSTQIKMRYFAGAGIAVLIAIPFVWSKVFGPTQHNRILALFDPQNAKYAAQMYQQNQGIAAIASGEIWGYGFLNGPKTQYGGVPENQNDMIFTVAGEELGLIGCLAILFLIVVILIRMIIDSASAKDEMGAIICVGAFAAFSIQIIVNLGMVLRVLPVVGLALPFFSSGGSTTLSSFMTIGLILSVYMHRKDLMFAGQLDS